MRRYVCHHCDDLECDSSVCPICGEQTQVEQSSIYWCDHCNVPVYETHCDICHNNCREIGHDIRPVFPEERLLIEILNEEPFAYASSSVWSLGGASYVIDGKRVNYSYSKMMEHDSVNVMSLLKSCANENQKYIDSYMASKHVKNFIEANKAHLSRIEYEAIDYIQRKSSGVGLDRMFVSFSGGKDSTVTSSLVMNALGREDIIHVYGDTTLEYPSSEVYLRRFRKQHPRTPILVARNENSDFYANCKVLGPPSRVMRWCCTFFKTGAITSKFDSVFPGIRSVLSFQGIRRAESNSRSDYERDSSESKIARQDVAQVIIDWTNFDVWLYLISHNVDFNDAYRQGFSRVGCWCCPNNSAWSGYLASIYMHEQSERFINMLYAFARDEIRKTDWKEYVDGGGWRARQGGEGLSFAQRTDYDFKPCALEDDAYNFELTRPIGEALFNLFTPFGLVNKTLGNRLLGEVFIIDRKSKQLLLKLSGRQGKTLFKVSVINKIGPFAGKSPQTIEAMIKAQVTKYQLCMACTACNSICRHGAISVMNTDKNNPSPDAVSYYINPEKCVGCLSCVLHFENGCYMKKVTRVRKGN